MQNMVLKANQFFTEKQSIYVMDNKITVKSFCTERCDNVWSRISAIVIETETAPKKEDDNAD